MLVQQSQGLVHHLLVTIHKTNETQRGTYQAPAHSIKNSVEKFWSQSGQYGIILSGQYSHFL